MNKKIRIFAVLIFLILILFPLKNVSAATYTTYWANVHNIAPSSKPCLSNGKCYITKSLQHSFTGDFNLHEVKDGNNVYLGYCLHAGRIVTNNVKVKYHEGFDDLRDSNNRKLSASRQKLLENILASGVQLTRNGSSVINGGSLFNATNKINVTCRQGRETSCKRLLATQILVWEVMEGARDNYNYRPNTSVAPSSNGTYDFVKTDSGLRDAYEGILDAAKELSNDSVPTFADKTHGSYVMHWKHIGEMSSNVKDYYTVTIDLGEKYKDYKVDSDEASKLGITYKKSGNKITLYTRNELKNAKLPLYVVKGSTSSNAATFRWYSFGLANHQDVVMGDQQVKKTVNITLNTEVGKIKIIKKDENKKNLLGSKFEIYKCEGEKCNKTKVATVDLTKKAESDTITLKKSGTYYVSETQTPTGHDSVGNFFFVVSISNNGNTNITKITGSKANNISRSNNNTTLAVLNVYNTSKRIKIKKIDGQTKSEIKGTTFEILDSKGNVLKFSGYGSGNNHYFKYDTAGKITKLTESNLSTYSIAGLPDGTYTLFETAVPEPYKLPSSENDRKTSFKIEKGVLSVYNYTKKAYERSSNVTVTVSNYKTSFKLEKTGTDNKKLVGVVFSLYKEKDNESTKIQMWSSNNGVYSYAKDSTSQTQTTELVTNKDGRVEINSLPVGTYWIKEEKTVDDYVIDESVKWVQINVVVNRTNTYTSFKRPDESKWTNVSFKEIYSWTNAKGEFCFYKIDEDGNYLNSGKFKVQSYDEKTDKYVDMSLTYLSDKKKYSFDSTGKSDIYTFSPISDGQTCFVNVNTQGRYRIVEIEAPEGFELGSVNDTSAEFVVNSEGYVSGNTTIINKKITKGEGADAQAELVINISTGQTVIKYGLIITVIVAAIIGLLILNKKMSKK